MNARNLFVAMSAGCLSAVVSAQGAPDPRPGASTPVQVMNATANPVPVQGNLTINNGPSSPIPVTGTVTVNTSSSSPLVIDGTVDTIAGDRTINVLRDTLTATTTEFANHRISIDTAPFKTIRISARRSSCTGCGAVEFRVASGHFGSTMEFVRFATIVDDYFEGSFSRSFDVPGTSILLEVRNVVPGQTNSVAFEVAGRAN